MLHNLQQSLSFLAALGVAVEEVGARDVHEGNLKAILGLFFQLSRYKQQQKQLQMQQQQVSQRVAKKVVYVFQAYKITKYKYIFIIFIHSYSNNYNSRGATAAPPPRSPPCPPPPPNRPSHRPPTRRPPPPGQ